jgi:hypothetical protein
LSHSCHQSTRAETIQLTAEGMRNDVVSDGSRDGCGDAGVQPLQAAAGGRPQADGEDGGCVWGLRATSSTGAQAAAGEIEPGAIVTLMAVIRRWMHLFTGLFFVGCCVPEVEHLVREAS